MTVRRRGKLDDPEWVFEERTRRISRTASSVDRFDRLAYARSVLRVLPLQRLSVAFYTTSTDLRIERGRAWGAGPDAEWAMVAIPPDASREQIAVALADIAGVAREPWVVEALLHMGRAS